MNIVKSVVKALTEWEQGDLEAAMLHATAAIDGTAGKSGRSTRKQFISFLHGHIDVVQAMVGAVTMDLSGSRFGQLPVIGGVASSPMPDFAELIYAVHRCAHGHGSDVPFGYESAEGNWFTLQMADGDAVRLPPSVIPGLTAAVVTCPQNRGESGGGDSWLSWEHPGAGPLRPRREVLLVRDWWGRKRDFLELTRAPQSTFATHPVEPWEIKIAHPDLPVVLELFE